MLGATTVAAGSVTTGSTHSSGSGTSTQPYQFLFNLSIGMTQSDVAILQQIFIAKGYLVIPAPTGYFGPLTLAAAKAYQGAHGIITTGFVGPLTRGALNQGL